MQASGERKRLALLRHVQHLILRLAVSVTVGTTASADGPPCSAELLNQQALVAMCTPVPLLLALKLILIVLNKPNY